MTPPRTLILSALIISTMLLNVSAQQTQTLSISRLTPAQRSDALSKIANQYLVLQDGTFIQIQKAMPETLASELDNQRLFASSRVTNYEMKHFDDDLAQRGFMFIDSTVSQSVEGDKYLVDSNSMMVEVPGNKVLVDGNRIRGIGKYVGPYNYTTVMGASRRVDHVRLVDVGNPTEAQILSTLSNEGVFQIVIPAMLKCPQCGGLGTIRDDPRDSLKSRTCNVCSGKRKIAGGQLVTITK